MGNKKVSIFCPLCEKKLLKTMASGEIEVSCPRCRAELTIRLTDIGVSVAEAASCRR